MGGEMEFQGGPTQTQVFFTLEIGMAWSKSQDTGGGGRLGFAGG